MQTKNHIKLEHNFHVNIILLPLSLSSFWYWNTTIYKICLGFGNSKLNQKTTS